MTSHAYPGKSNYVTSSPQKTKIDLLNTFLFSLSFKYNMNNRANIALMLLVYLVGLTNSGNRHTHARPLWINFLSNSFNLSEDMA